MPTKHGRVEVICGCMFSGKTEELIRRVKRAVIARQKVQVFKPKVDTRHAINVVRDHNGAELEATPIDSSHELLRCVHKDTQVVAIDEAQFFDPGIERVVVQLSSRGIRVILAGLDLDFRGEPFGSIPNLLARAREVYKLPAICQKCGEDATRTQRIINGQPAMYDDPVILVGASESYEARCEDCHVVLGEPM